MRTPQARGKIGVWTHEAAQRVLLDSASGDRHNRDSEYNLAGYSCGQLQARTRHRNRDRLVVPATGLAINIQRTYDSLNAATISDFGYGWSLGINVNLIVDSGNVTFTLGGQRQHLLPHASDAALSPLIGCLFPYYFVTFTPEPGFHGTLTDSLRLSARHSCSRWQSVGLRRRALQSARLHLHRPDRHQLHHQRHRLSAVHRRPSGNGLTITPNGITSTTGLNVPFVRDSSGRITQITDTAGQHLSLHLRRQRQPRHRHLYPNTRSPAPTPTRQPLLPERHRLPQQSAAHRPPTTAQRHRRQWHLPLNGRLQSVTDAWARHELRLRPRHQHHHRHLSARRQRQSGTATMVYDTTASAQLHRSARPHHHQHYDANHNLISVTDPLGHATTYTYDANGNRLRHLPGHGHQHQHHQHHGYNQYSEPTSTTDELGNVRTFNYDANYNPQNVTDTLALWPASFQRDSTWRPAPSATTSHAQPPGPASSPTTPTATWPAAPTPWAAPPPTPTMRSAKRSR